jgi:hypothetical protein
VVVVGKEGSLLISCGARAFTFHGAGKEREILLVKLIYLGLNLIFDIRVVFIATFFVGGDISVDSEVLLVTDFVNLNIKSV